MKLGTIWNRCRLIRSGGCLDPWVERDPARFARWEVYRRRFPGADQCTVWLDLDCHQYFSAAQLRWGPSGKEHNFLDSREDFLCGQWGLSFLEAQTRGNQIFRSQEAVLGRECIYGNPELLARYRGSSVLAVFGGPSTEETQWKDVSTDYTWSCNKFYLHPALASRRLDLVSLATDVDLVRNEPLDAYLQANPETTIAFELERDGGQARLNDTLQFIRKQRSRCCYYHTRYSSALGLGVRMLCFAVAVGVKDLYFVGLDGTTALGTRHVFEPGKPVPKWYERYGDHFQKRQYVVFWDYMLALCDRFGVNLYNLGELSPHNLSREISGREFPLSAELRQKIRPEPPAICPEAATQTASSAPG